MIGENQAVIFKVCLMFTDRRSEDIRDLYQDIVCNLWEGWSSFDSRSAVSTWVYRVAFNTALNNQRRDSRRPELVTLDDSTCEAMTQEAHNEMVERLYALADRLKPDEKALLRLYLDKVKLRDIAEILGTTEAAVKHRIQRMKEHLIMHNREDQK